MSREDSDKFYDLADEVAVDFDPTDRETVVAAFALRTALLNLTSCEHPIFRPSLRMTAALNVLRGTVPSALTLAFFAASPPEHGDIEALVSFEDRFIGVGPSLRVGALLAAGLSAPAPTYSRVHTVDVAERLAEFDAAEQESDLHSANMALVAGPMNAARALRLLLVAPTVHAETYGPDVARPHIEWCITNYLAAS